MAGVNFAVLVGNLGADPEVRTLQSGGRAARLRLATGESWKDRTTGERRERTEWHDVVIWSEGLVGVAERFLKKGSRVFVRGTIRTRKWQDQAGQDRYTTEIVLSGFDAQLVLLDPAGGGRTPIGEAPDGPASSAPETAASAGGGSETLSDDLDDDIPF